MKTSTILDCSSKTKKAAGTEADTTFHQKLRDGRQFVVVSRSESKGNFLAWKLSTKTHQRWERLIENVIAKLRLPRKRAGESKTATGRATLAPHYEYKTRDCSFRICRYGRSCEIIFPYLSSCSLAIFEFAKTLFAALQFSYLLLGSLTRQ